MENNTGQRGDALAQHWWAGAGSGRVAETTGLGRDRGFLVDRVQSDLDRRRPRGEHRERMETQPDRNAEPEVAALLATIFNATPIGFYIVQDGRFLLTNPYFQQHTGYTGEELVGTDSMRLVHPEDRARVRESSIAMLKGQRSEPYEFRGVLKSGQEQWLLGTVVSVRFRERRATLGTYMDITEQKRLQDQVEERARQVELRTQELAALNQLVQQHFMGLELSPETRSQAQDVFGEIHKLLDEMK